jgi:drug/metabolite transporter (DMT)-like permease
MSRFIPIILFTVATNALAQIALKRGMLSVGPVNLDNGLVKTVLTIALNPLVIAGFTLFVVSMASHLVALSRVDLSYAYPFLSLAYVIIAVYGYFAGESLSVERMLGYALIVGGTIVVARS